MPSSATVTAKTGPNVTNTAIVLTNVTRLNYDISGLVLFITSNGVIKQYDLSGVTTVTTTISGTTFTVTIS